MKAIKFTESDIKILLNDKYKSVWVAMLTMGLRISELKQLEYEACLKYENINIKSAKGSNSKVVKVSQTFKQYLSEINKEKWDKLKSNSRFGYNKRLKKLLNKNMGVSTHSFRKSIAYECYKKYNDILRVKNILGHKSLSSTSYYLDSNFINDGDEYFKL